MTAIDKILNPRQGSTDPNRSDLKKISKLDDDHDQQDFENLGPLRTDHYVDDLEKRTLHKLILSIID